MISVGGVLTWVATHDSQVAIPLAYMTDEKAVNLYDLTDSVYDVPRIYEVSQQLGHAPLIDVNSRRNSVLKAEIAAENSSPPVS